MTRFSEYLLLESKLHPSMEPQDAVKLCHQGALGPGHLIADEEKARRYFRAEYADAAFHGEPLTQPISADYCRISLPAWREAGFPADWLLRMFLLSAQASAAEGQTHFSAYLEESETLAAAGLLPFSSEALRDYLCAYGKPHAVHHSDAYRAAEHPAYRVVTHACADLVPLLQKIASCGASRPVVALDGRAASGKSITAALLGGITGGSLIHMDDFFLPKELRTEKRLQEPGGNIHYERFAEEVLPHLGGEQAFSYGVFDCSVMTITKTHEIAPAPLYIVEGSYSHHPHFGDYAHVKAFCDVSPEEQMQRIEQRDGAIFAQRFRDQWIPMEEWYFQHFSIREQAHICLTPGNKEETSHA